MMNLAILWFFPLTRFWYFSTTCVASGWLHKQTHMTRVTWLGYDGSWDSSTGSHSSDVLYMLWCMYQKAYHLFCNKVWMFHLCSGHSTQHLLSGSFVIYSTRILSMYVTKNWCVFRFWGMGVGVRGCDISMDSDMIFFLSMSFSSVKTENKIAIELLDAFHMYFPSSWSKYKFNATFHKKGFWYVDAYSFSTFKNLPQSLSFGLHI